MKRMAAFMVISALALAAAGAALRPAAAQAPPPSSGGPVVLMGIDAEDGGPGGHGPPSTYTKIVNQILAQVTKPAPNQVLVIGCHPPYVTTFWAAVFPAHKCIATGAAIHAEDFTDDRLIAIASDQNNTFGGLTCNDEDPALDDPTTQAKIAAHVNAGGGVLGFTSDCPRPYQYIAGVAQISVSIFQSYFDIDPTTEGLLLGVDDTLDVCCWHDTFLSFPSFLKVLAFEHGTSEAAAIGGKNVVLPPPLVPTRLELTPDRSENIVGSTATFNAIVYDQFDRPMKGVPVTFVVTGVSGPFSETHTTDKDGVATLQYSQQVTPGTDTIEACVEVEPTDPLCEAEDQPRDAPSVKTWILPVSTPNCAVNLNKPTWGIRITAANGDKVTAGGVAQVGPHGETKGEIEVQDHGPAEDFNYHGEVLAVLCFAADPVTGQPARATIFSLGKNAGSINVVSRTDVTDQGEGATAADTFRFRLGSNYDTQEQPLKGGNVQIHQT